MVQVKKKVADPSNPFQKRKQKVGKKKLKPVNATKAEVHAASLFMRKQTREETTQYQNQRKLTFADCVGKLKHYNASVRKDGVFGVLSMLKVTVDSAVEAIPPSQHATLVQCVFPLIIDADVEVRRAVAALIKVALKLFALAGTLRALLPLAVRYNKKKFCHHHHLPHPTGT